MTTTVFATRATPPPPKVSPWTHNQLTWTVDGKEWDLSTGEQGAVLLSGVRGFNMPPFARHTQKSPAVAGSRRRGRNTDEREVFWPLEVFHTGSSMEWQALDSEFWATMHPDKTGVWTVRQPNGTARHLTLSFAGDGDPSYDIAPELVGWMTYGITLVAEQPYWTGKPQVAGPFMQEEPVGFFDPAGSPPFHVSSALTLAGATMTNPGDERGWLVWTLAGPTTSATFGVGGQNIVVPFPLAAGQWLRIDTAPTDRRAMVGSIPLLPGQGVNRTRELGAATRFASIPAGADRPISLSMVGAGSITAQLVPLHHRAW